MESKQHLGSYALNRYQTEGGASAYAGKFERSRSRRRTSRREYGILDTFLKHIESPQGSLLNIACGAGRFHELLCPENRKEVTYADFSSEMLEESRQKMLSLGCDHIDFRRCDATKDEAIPGFELVFNIRMLHHMKTLELQNSSLDFLCGSSAKWLIFTCASTSTFKGWCRNRRTQMGLRKRGEILLDMSDLEQRLSDRGFEICKRAFVDRLFSSQTWILAQRK